MKQTMTIIFLLAACHAYPQEQGRFTSGDPLDTRRLSALAAQAKGMALESTVDPARYFVGPSDVLAVNIWMSPPQNFNLTVTPEGTLIIPAVGEVRVAGLSLADAKAEIYTQVRRKYLSAEITATLVTPRPIVVTVVGHVVRDGRYELTAIDRADRLIDLANAPGETGGPGEAVRLDRERIVRETALRSIVLKHRDGTEDGVDIVRFRATKDDRWNPYLREGDIVVVPRMTARQNVFGVYGEVNVPGRFELAAGDSLFAAIDIAQGFTRLARTDSIEFSRLGADGRTMQVSFLDFGDRRDPSLNVPLEPGDRIIVRAREEARADYRVFVYGEVPQPGTYPITRDRSKLSDLIRVAGGFTEFAALKSASLSRRSVESEDVETERLMSFRGGVASEDSVDYLRETALRLRREIVNVDFEALFVKGDSSQDVILRDGDEILIPSVTKTIYVFGQIVSPGHIPYVPGEDADYYVRQAGGLTERARGDDIQVIKAKTKQWLSPDDTELEDGDYIWVPRDPDRPFSYYMTVGSQAASILSVVLGIGILIYQVTN